MSYQINKLAMSIIVTIVKILAVCYSSIKPQVEKESGAEEEEAIGDSEEPLNKFIN